MSTSDWMREAYEEEGRARSADLRTDVAHPARVYDAALGGKDNFPADRAALQQILTTAPWTRTVARENRAFMHRVVRTLAREHGVRQFLDVGTGIPTAPNLHEVAQAVSPDARVVYVDNDPTVLVHARALLAGTPEGRTAYAEADLRDADAVLAAPELAATLDLSEPVALTLIAVLHYLPDEAEAAAVVRRLTAALAPGSFLALTHFTTDLNPDLARSIADYRTSGVSLRAVDRDGFAGFLDGLEVLDPGVVSLNRWNPDGTRPEVPDSAVNQYAALARKPL